MFLVLGVLLSSLGVPMYQTPKGGPASAPLLAAVWAVAFVLTVAIGVAAQVLIGNVA
jgi:hypothetical protein